MHLNLAEQASISHLQVPLAHNCRHNNQQHTCQDHQGCIVLGKAQHSPFTLGLLTHSLQHTHSTAGICLAHILSNDAIPFDFVCLPAPQALQPWQLHCQLPLHSTSQSKHRCQHLKYHPRPAGSQTNLSGHATLMCCLSALMCSKLTHPCGLSATSPCHQFFCSQELVLL